MDVVCQSDITGVTGAFLKITQVLGSAQISVTVGAAGRSLPFVEMLMSASFFDGLDF